MYRFGLTAAGVLLLAFGVASAQTPQTARGTPVEQIAAQTCAACHGPAGTSAGGGFPNLAGQNEDYLYKQLGQFKGRPGGRPLRTSEVMGPIVQSLDDEQMKALARLYSRQLPGPGKATNPTLVEAGRSVYWKGNPANGLPACVSCHRPNGEGIAPDFPRIAGQHPEYVVGQLKAWKSGTRGGPGKLMSLLVPLMTEQEITAVAQYVAQLK
ncbi:cytochrome C [Burkholderiaceae bacterium 16]|nr:cytochrome C [Burkholderiaceae bacterium 16]